MEVKTDGFRLSINNRFGINVYLSDEKRQKTKHPNDQPKKDKKYRRIEWRSWHRPCPLERLFFSQELFAQVSPLHLSLKDCKWDVCEKEPHWL